MMNGRAPQGIASLRPFAEGGTVRWDRADIGGFDLDQDTINRVHQQLLAQEAQYGKNWSGDAYKSDREGILRDMANTLVASGVSDINQVARGADGKIVNKDTGSQLLSGYGDRTKGPFWSGTYSGEGNTGYGVQFDAEGKPVFFTQEQSSSDLHKIAPLLTIASFIPGVAPFAQGINALIAADQGNWLQAIAGAAGAIPGISEVAGFGSSLGSAMDIAGVPLSTISKGASTLNALDQGNVLGAVMGAADLAGVKQIDMPGVGKVDINKAVQGISAVNAAQSGDYIRALTQGLSAAGVDVPPELGKIASMIPSGGGGQAAAAPSEASPDAAGLGGLNPQAVLTLGALMSAQQAGKQDQEPEKAEVEAKPLELFSDDIFAGRRGYAGGGMVKRYDAGGITSLDADFFDGGAEGDYGYTLDLGGDDGLGPILDPEFDYNIGREDIDETEWNTPDTIDGVDRGTLNSTLSGLIKQVGGAAKSLLGDGKGGWDWSKIAALAGGAYGFTRPQQDLSNVGFNGGIPTLTAQRAQVPYASDANRRPGEGGRRYFSDTVYDSPANAQAAYGRALEQAQGIAALQRPDGSMRNTLAGGYGDKRPELGYPGAEPPRDYQAPPVGGMLFKGLTSGSDPREIARAYNQWVTQGQGGAGGQGDTQAARGEAEAYLKNLGVDWGKYQQAYDMYKGKQFASGGLASLDPAKRSYIIQQALGQAAKRQMATDGMSYLKKIKTSGQYQQPMNRLASDFGLTRDDLNTLLRQNYQTNPNAMQDAMASEQANANFGVGLGGGTPVFQNATQAHQWKMAQARKGMPTRAPTAAQQMPAQAAPAAPAAPVRPATSTMPTVQQSAGAGAVASQPAAGGVASLPQAGGNRFGPMRQAWNFAAGGQVPRYLDGPTNGLDDEIPATIEGQEPAALGHGEFVVSADVVAALGGGNSQAGAQELYAMMDRIRQQATGSKQQMRRVDPGKALPA